jgi:SAM-dependent methyltransferase
MADDKWFANGDAYEGYIGRWSRPAGRMFLSWLSQPGELRWVDVGCGTGALSEVIIERNDPLHVTGIELSDGFLSLARDRIVDERADFRLGDAQCLPLDDNVADVSVSGLVLNFVPDKERALEEMSRIVEPGGTVAAYVWDYAGEMQIIRHFWDAASELFPDAADRHEGMQFPICRPEALADLFQAGGLQSVETTALDTPAVFSDFDDYWRPFLRGQGPAGDYCVSLLEGDRARLRSRLEESLPVRPDGTLELIARAWAVRGKT